ncbi:MAG: hypothetical protein Ct9H300mP18_06660 [Candidatus Neomarinimicrobiota bacterium]|nr:MAG: hypothetical protein Ct9H300mP18_06660 [Candidatus Neomarinimicrobiota bacterium]
MAHPMKFFLQDHLDNVFDKGKTKVILPITDPYVVHHGHLVPLLQFI